MPPSAAAAGPRLCGFRGYPALLGHDLGLSLPCVRVTVWASESPLCAAGPAAAATPWHPVEGRRVPRIGYLIGSCRRADALNFGLQMADSCSESCRASDTVERRLEAERGRPSSAVGHCRPSYTYGYIPHIYIERLLRFQGAKSVLLWSKYCSNAIHKCKLIKSIDAFSTSNCRDSSIKSWSLISTKLDSFGRQTCCGRLKSSGINASFDKPNKRAISLTTYLKNLVSVNQ